MAQLKKKYGLFTAISMVVGIVIGSGVFFKAQNVLNTTGGDMPLGIIAWLTGGVVMIVCGYNFANFATRYEKVGGLVDYAEAMLGERYSYFVGWFIATLYVPGMASALAWVSARYTLCIFMPDAVDTTMASPECLCLAGFYLIMSYCVNTISPKIAGKLQVSMTIIKLIPLVLMAVVGIIVGLKNGNIAQEMHSFGAGATEDNGMFSSLFASVVAVAFAYEGWILATSINAELKDSKKNLPRAIVAGCSLIMIVYILYYVGISGSVNIDELRFNGANYAFNEVFGKFSLFFNVCIAVSCMGTLNGLMLSSTRGLYALSVRGKGPSPKLFAEVSSTTNMPVNSSAFGLAICSFWLLFFFFSNVSTHNYFGVFAFDSSELPIITIYAFYIPMFFMYIIKNHKDGIIKHVILPSLGIICCCFMIFAALYAHGITPYLAAKERGEFACPVLIYLLVFCLFMIIGAYFYNRSNKHKNK